MTRLDLLQRTLAEGRTDALTFYAFDLVYLNSVDLSSMTLTRRKAALADIFTGVPDLTPKIRLSQTFADGEALFARACAAGMEGIVSKRADASYIQARSTSWLKVKRREAGTFTVVGFIANRPDEVSSVVLAETSWAGLALSCRAGVAGLGYELHERLTPIERSTPPVRSDLIKGVRWVDPVLTAQVTYLGRSGRGVPRSPVVTGISLETGRVIDLPFEGEA